MRWGLKNSMCKYECSWAWATVEAYSPVGCKLAYVQLFNTRTDSSASSRCIRPVNLNAFPSIIPLTCAVSLALLLQPARRTAVTDTNASTRAVKKE